MLAKLTAVNFRVLLIRKRSKALLTWHPIPIWNYLCREKSSQKLFVLRWMKMKLLKTLTLKSKIQTKIFRVKMAQGTTKQDLRRENHLEKTMDNYFCKRFKHRNFSILKLISLQFLQLKSRRRQTKRSIS